MNLLKNGTTEKFEKCHDRNISVKTGYPIGNQLDFCVKTVYQQFNFNNNTFILFAVSSQIKSKSKKI